MKYIFGPVASRRLGRSLGVDLIPYKTCSFDCIYCECGTTTTSTLDRKEYVPRHEILSGVKEYLKQESVPPDHITLGGSGEPTLHAGIGELIAEIKCMSTIPIAVLTNGSLLFMKEVREALLQADVVLPSLDAVSPYVFQCINRPHPTLAIETIIQGLKDFRKAFKGKLWLEILFCQGVNDTEEEIARLVKTVREINPDKIQLNSLDRPPAEELVCPVRREKLEQIRSLFGDKAEIVTGLMEGVTEGSLPEGKERIIELLKRRPCPLDEISRALGIRKKQVAELIDILTREGEVHYRIHNNQRYYLVR